jgi:hypothetical protein
VAEDAKRGALLDAGGIEPERAEQIDEVDTAKQVLGRELGCPCWLSSN